jgi:hypothetical protein
MIHHLDRKPGPAYAARLERHVQRRRALAAAAAANPALKPAPAALHLTFAQKTASERRLCCTAVAGKQPFLTFQEKNHARLL